MIHLSPHLTSCSIKHSVPAPAMGAGCYGPTTGFSDPTSLTSAVRERDVHGRQFFLPVTVRLTTWQAQDVRPIANSTFVQVSFRLPDTLAPGTCTLRIKAHAQVSNGGTIRIKP
jgi:hypothetical protein